MCNALWSFCYSVSKGVRYLETWDLNPILDLGNSLYQNMGYSNQYLSFGELPSSIIIDDFAIKVEKRGSVIRELTAQSNSFLRIDASADGLIFLAAGFGTSIVESNGIVYIFDSHSRDTNGMLHPQGTSVLLKFNSIVLAEQYLKQFYLFELQNEMVFYEIEHFKFVLTDAETEAIKRKFQGEWKRQSNKDSNLVSPRKKRYAGLIEYQKRKRKG